MFLQILFLRKQRWLLVIAVSTDLALIESWVSNFLVTQDDLFFHTSANSIPINPGKSRYSQFSYYFWLKAFFWITRKSKSYCLLNNSVSCLKILFFYLEIITKLYGIFPKVRWDIITNWYYVFFFITFKLYLCYQK